MSSPDDELRRRQRKQWSAMAGLLLGVGLVVAALRWRAWLDVDEAERRRLDGQAHTIEQVVGQQLRAVHGALRAIRDDVALWADDGPDASSRRIGALVAAVPGLASIVVFAADGRVVAASGPPRPERTPPAAGRDPATLQVRPPVRDAAGRTSVDLVLPAADGSAVVATLNGDDLRVALRSVLYAADVRAGITHAGGGLLLFEPRNEAAESRSLAALGPFFERHRASGREANLFSGPIAGTGDERMIAVRTLRPAGVVLDAPLVVSVSREVDAVFATWREQSALNAGLVALLAVGLAASLGVAQRRQRALWAARQAAAEREGAEAARLELALRGADLGLWDHDLVSSRGTVDARWSGMLGYPPGPFEQGTSTWQSLIHPDDRALVAEERRAHLEGRTEAFDAVYRMRHRDGHWVWILDRGKVIERAADGTPLRMVGTHLDISHRMATEQALRAVEQQSRALVEHLPTGVVVHDADGRVVDANPAACRLLGVDELRGTGLSDRDWGFVDADGAPLPVDRLPVNVVLATGEPLTNVAGGVRLAGQERPRWLLLSAFPVRAGSGAIEQVVVTLLDVTEQRQAELDRRALEAQLREAQKMESIGTLAGGIAHDFNNILAAILGNVALARSDIGAAHPAQASLEQIQKSGLRARSLVQQILAFSRRAPGTLALQPLRPIVDETLAMLRATLPAAVRLDVDLPDAPLPVRAEATQLQQVLMNLATNAWHALPPEGGRIAIGAERIDAGAAAALREPGLAAGPAAHLWVRDDGHGMDAATLARIFDPFFTTKPVGVGTGLGLSVVHGIVRAHAGAIRVESRPGAGTTFHLYLPSPDGDDADPTPEQAASAAGGGRGEHVLYVDDDEVMVVLAARLLERAGYRVTTRTSADEALAVVGADGVDAVVTDYNMPGTSGLELARRLAALRPGLAIVLTSGLVSDALRDQARAAGVRAVLRKEHTLEELAPTVARVLAEGVEAPS